jgi:hypothetical protein
LLIQKRNFFKANPVTYYTQKSSRAEIPLVFPTSKISGQEYINNSEKKRFEKVTDQFMKLKQYIIHDEKNEKNYIKEFMIKNGIYDNELYTIDKLTNFGNFLFSNLQIDTSKNLKEIIRDACFFDPENIPEIKKFVKQSKKRFTSRQITPERNEKSNNLILDKKLEFYNPKTVMNNFENELSELNTSNLPFIKKNNKTFELDLGNSYRIKKGKIDHVRKKNKLLEYVVWERSKSKI